jgi:hypothetical protein
MSNTGISQRNAFMSQLRTDRSMGHGRYSYSFTRSNYEAPHPPRAMCSKSLKFQEKTAKMGFLVAVFAVK